MTCGATFFKRKRDYKPLYKSLEKRVGAEKAKHIFFLAGKELEHLMHCFPDRPKGERNHTDHYIFPRVAIYRVLKREFGDEAIKLMEDAVKMQGEKMGTLLRKFTAFPFAERLFLKIFAQMAKRMFGEKMDLRKKCMRLPLMR